MLYIFFDQAKLLLHFIHNNSRNTRGCIVIKSSRSSQGRSRPSNTMGYSICWSPDKLHFRVITKKEEEKVQWLIIVANLEKACWFLWMWSTTIFQSNSRTTYCRPRSMIHMTASSKAIASPSWTGRRWWCQTVLPRMKLSAIGITDTHPKRCETWVTREVNWHQHCTLANQLAAVANPQGVLGHGGRGGSLKLSNIFHFTALQMLHNVRANLIGSVIVIERLHDLEKIKMLLNINSFLTWYLIWNEVIY